MVDRCITIHVPLDNVVHNPCLLYEVMNAYIRAFLRLDYNLSRRQIRTDRHTFTKTYVYTNRQTHKDRRAALSGLQRCSLQCSYFLCLSSTTARYSMSM